MHCGSRLLVALSPWFGCLLWSTHGAPVAHHLYPLSPASDPQLHPHSLRDRSIRVVRHIDTGILAALLDRLFTRQDSAGDIRNLYIGVSTSQKMELLKEIVHCVGYESVAVFGDCFDECPLLDPVQHPTALKVFAARICRNDLLSVGRQHWFFPDSRLGLDLNTDRTLKEARFDRHFVRDLTWSRHQLEQLAQRRFEAARMQSQVTAICTRSARVDVICRTVGRSLRFLLVKEVLLVRDSVFACPSPHSWHHATCTFAPSST